MIHALGGRPPTGSKLLLTMNALLSPCSSGSNTVCWLQGYNATPANIELVIAAFRDGLQQQGYVKE